jgi:hypothetical protein
MVQPQTMTYAPAAASPYTFEGMLGQRLYTGTQEKTHTDKLLARQDIGQIQALIKKDDLTRSELLEMMYLLSSSEIKLANFGEHDRYLLGKFLAWIRDFTNVCEILYDYREAYEKIDAEDPDKETKEDMKGLMESNRKYMLHNIKFLVDLFLYLSRSTLSLSMSAFEILSTAKYEYAYADMMGLNPKPQEPRMPFKLNMRP